ncbi:MAG: DUF4919 domain-containing protein [Bacteroidota bacterium]
MKKATRFLTFLLFSLSFFTAKSQVIFGESIEAFEQRVRRDSAEYQSLAQRFSSGDTTLTLPQLTFLYFGSAFRSGYQPSQEERILGAGSALAQREKFEDALRLFQNLLTKNPACLPAWLEKAYTQWSAGDSLSVGATYKQYFQLLQAPLTSGNGESPEKAFVVRSVRDIELVLNELGYDMMEHTLLKRNGQNFQVVTCSKEDNPGLQRDLYFNVQLPLTKEIRTVVKKKQGN